jgi:hypothetical protein
VIIEQFGEIQLNDLSTEGPFDWEWHIFDTNQAPAVHLYTTDRDFGSDPKNPVYTMNDPGKYNVCLVAYNGIGASPEVCKTNYFEVTEPQDLFVGFGPQETELASGRIYDHNGPNLDYGNNRDPSSDRLRILPCGAESITLNFTQIKLNDASDIIEIFDGPEQTAPIIATYVGGQTYNTPLSITGTSGALLVTFKSNNGGNDSGFIGTWTSKLGPQIKPAPDFFTNCSPVGNSTATGFFDNSLNVLGIADYQWTVDEGGFITQYYSPDMEHTFFTDGTFNVCLTVATCSGSDTKCKSITVSTPNSKVDLDYEADNFRPNIGDEVQMSASSCAANRFKWEIFPNTFTYELGTDRNSRDPLLKFNQAGCYTFTLKSWNSTDSAATVINLVKDDYICVVDYCNPVSNILSSDIGFNNVELSDGSTNLIENTSTSGDQEYTNYTEDIAPAFLTFGATYTLKLERATTVNRATRYAWIDYNIDGDFDDPNEQIAVENNASTNTFTQTFTVPDLAEAFEGLTRMRVGIRYGSGALDPCGPAIVGEFEDYALTLNNDNTVPVLTLNGDDTVFVEVNGNPAYNDMGAVAIDPTEGDISSRIVTTTDFDQSTAGIYTYIYRVSDASGNPAIPVRRTLYVVLDRTPPVITLIGNPVIDVNIPDVPRETNPGATFTDPGATALDNVDGDLTSSITITGAVDVHNVGSYVLTYTVSDVQGNVSVATRTVNVLDLHAPKIVAIGGTEVQIGQVWVDQTKVGDNYYVVNLVRTPGFAGDVNPNVRGAYPICYDAIDGSGNAATQVCRSYEVRDFVPPVINLHTDEVINHSVNSDYVRVQPSVSDNYFPTGVSIVRSGDEVDDRTLGTYVEVYTAKDPDGNVTVINRTINVIDDVEPTITAEAINVFVGHDFDPMQTIIIRDNYYSPASLLNNVEIVSNNVNIWLEGVYSIGYRVTDPSGNKSIVFNRTVNVNYWNDNTTSIDDVSLDNSINVYPNPSSGDVNISFDLPFNTEVSIAVYNMTGQKVVDLGTVETGAENVSINMNDQANGVYLIKLTTQGKSVTKQLILNR